MKLQIFVVTNGVLRNVYLKNIQNSSVLAYLLSINERKNIYLSLFLRICTDFKEAFLTASSVICKEKWLFVIREKINWIRINAKIKKNVLYIVPFLFRYNLNIVLYKKYKFYNFNENISNTFC